MGDFKIGVAIKDLCYITDADGTPSLGLNPTHGDIDPNGNRAVRGVAEYGNGWYHASFTPDETGLWGTEFTVAGGKLIYGGINKYNVGGGIIAQSTQIFQTTIDLQQVAGTYDIAVGTTQDVTIEAVIFSPRIDVSDDVGGITGISIQTNTTTEQVLISAAVGVIANLTAEAQLAWNGPVLLRATDKIQLDILGAAADDPTTCDVVIKFRANTNGGYLA